MGKEEESKIAYARYKELEKIDKKQEDKPNIKIIENDKNLKLPKLNPAMMNSMMKDGNMMNLASKLMSNNNIRDKIMNEDFKNRMLNNPDLMKNPMEMMNDKNFQEIFSETLKILQEDN